MAFTITSASPLTGPATGGTTVTVVGTGLTAATSVEIGGKQATIVGTTTGTQLQFVTPPGTGSQAFTLLDPVADEAHNGASPFVFAAVTVDPQVTVLAKRLALRVNTGSYGSPTWTKVNGIKNIVVIPAKTSEDDSDIDSGVGTSTLETEIATTINLTLRRRRGTVSGNYDPGQQVFFAARDLLNTLIDVQWYDRTATQTTDEAKRAYVLSEWKPKGGNKTGDEVDVTLTVQGIAQVIDNPVIADPTLRAGY